MVKGHGEMKTPKDAIFWLKNGVYHIANFGDGVEGLCAHNGGGCWGVFAEGLVRELILEGYISRNGQLRRKGFLLAAEGSS